MIDASAALTAVAAHPLLSGPTIDLPPAEWPNLLALLRRERLAGAAWRSVCDGRLQVIDARRDELAAAHRRAAALDVRLDQELVAAVAMLELAGIDVRALKGSAIAHATYPDPALRSSGDVDLLVRGEQVDEAIALLDRTGARRRYPEPRRGFDRRFGKGAAMVCRSGTEIDLHRSLAQGPYGLQLRTDRLFEAQRVVVIAGRPVPALSAVDAAVHAAVHAVCGSAHPRTTELRDVLWTSAAPSVGASLGGRAEDLAVAPVVAAALRLAAERFGPDARDLLAVPLAWVAARREDAPHVGWLAAYQTDDRRSARLAAMSVAAVPWRDRPALAAALLAPEAHVRPPLARLARAVVER